MADRILIVDDDQAVLTMLYKIIRSNGMEAETASDGNTALTLLASRRFDLLLLDVNMPGMDGFTVVEAIRAKGMETPIIIISGRKEDYDTLYGLDLGADDYITKPFNPVVLAAKAKALIRRSKSNAKVVLTVGPFSYNTVSQRLYKNGVEIALTSKENAMMRLFLDNVDRIFPKDMLYELIWDSVIIDENAVMVYINRLRQKIEDTPSKPTFIRNVRGIGYRFVVESSSQRSDSSL